MTIINGESVPVDNWEAAFLWVKAAQNAGDRWAMRGVGWRDCGREAQGGSREARNAEMERRRSQEIEDRSLGRRAEAGRRDHGTGEQRSEVRGQGPGGVGQVVRQVFVGVGVHRVGGWDAGSGQETPAFVAASMSR
jgi:hypothetical protein